MPAFAAAGGYAKLMENCTSLDLSQNDMRTKEAEVLAASLSSNDSLTFMDVSGNSIGEEGMHAIGNALLSSRTSKLGAFKCDAFDLLVGTTSLNLSQSLGPAATIMLAGIIKFNASLTECNLRDNSLGVEGWTIIFNALRDSPTSKITTWDLSSERLGPEIAKPLAEYISVTPSITSVR